MKIKDGMRIKSKDIHFFQSIFYLANKKNIDISFFKIFSIGQKKYLNAWFTSYFLKIERACKYPTHKLMTT